MQGGALRRVWGVGRVRQRAPLRPRAVRQGGKTPRARLQFRQSCNRSPAPRMVHQLRRRRTLPSTQTVEGKKQDQSRCATSLSCRPRRRRPQLPGGHARSSSKAGRRVARVAAGKLLAQRSGPATTRQVLGTSPRTDRRCRPPNSAGGSLATPRAWFGRSRPRLNEAWRISPSRSTRSRCTKAPDTHAFSPGITLSFVYRVEVSKKELCC